MNLNTNSKLLTFVIYLSRLRRKSLSLIRFEARQKKLLNSNNDSLENEHLIAEEDSIPSCGPSYWNEGEKYGPASDTETSQVK